MSKETLPHSEGEEFERERLADKYSPERIVAALFLITILGASLAGLINRIF